MKNCDKESILNDRIDEWHNSETQVSLYEYLGLTKEELIDIETGELKKVIVWALDLDEWKHSWHNEISKKNYDKFLNIITDKIEKRAEEIQKLIAIYNRINSEK